MGGPISLTILFSCLWGYGFKNLKPPDPEQINLSWFASENPNPIKSTLVASGGITHMPLRNGPSGFSSLPQRVVEFCCMVWSYFFWQGGSTGAWIQGLMVVRQALYYLSHSTRPSMVCSKPLLCVSSPLWPCTHPLVKNHSKPSWSWHSLWRKCYSLLPPLVTEIISILKNPTQITIISIRVHLSWRLSWFSEVHNSV
jgi:hypothetical protein